MAGVGGVLIPPVDGIDPRSLFTKACELIDSQDVSGLGPLLQKGSISVHGYMTGKVVQQISDIAKCRFEMHGISSETHIRVRLIAMELAMQALIQQHEMQEGNLEISVKHAKLLEKFASQQINLIVPHIEQFVQKTLEFLITTIEIPEKDKREMLINLQKNTFNSGMISLESIFKAVAEVAEQTNLRIVDQLFFNECTQQAGLILAEVCVLAQRFADEDPSQFNMIISQISERVRSLIS